ncbi:hypothetical protein NP233_g2406 [Leucocoprinus birnbaumii]|uniref:FAD-binding domain-containing protein n=1 Tax=Leucocoprinus birnbaumii TaxID=56174 RepID=A0AAD5VYD3_9AGAR|nr:hypothetical protein NP233_g2406 [Leucocoprinus birnbaumii]
MSRPYEPQDEIRVAIVGAGIVGLVLAVTLNTFDIERKISIDIYEASAELSEIGAGINIWPRTWRIFQEIGPGLGDMIKPFFDHPPDLKLRPIFEVRKADQKDGFKVTDIKARGASASLTDHETFSSLLSIKVGHSVSTEQTFNALFLSISLSPLIPIAPLPKNSRCALHLSHRLIDYVESKQGPVTLHFSDQPPRTCDILIGADGIKSTVRKIFLSRLPNSERYTRCMDPVWSGAIAYRGLVKREELESVYPGHRALGHPGLMYFGKNKHTVVYPISGGKFINVVAAIHNWSKEGTEWDGNRPLNEEVPQQEFLKHFESWEDEYKVLISCIKQPTRWALQRMNHLDTFARGKVFLMGDSVCRSIEPSGYLSRFADHRLTRKAHAMVPYQGAGAAVGIDDAYIFACLLTHPSTPRTLSPQCTANLAEAYNRTCVPRAHHFSKLSTFQGQLNTLRTPECDVYRENDGSVPREILLDVFRQAERNWCWTVSDVREDRRKAEGILRKLVNGKEVMARL